MRLAAILEGEILSADSRQVYRGLDIGAGKDLKEYTVDGHAIPYHLIDIADLDEEFSVFHYQQAFYPALEGVRGRDRLPIVVGGTGLYLDAVLRGYPMVPVPENPALRATLSGLDMEALALRLHELKNTLHNRSDTGDRDRLIRAIEIAEYTRDHPPQPVPEVQALVLIVNHDPEILRRRIAMRLRERMDNGLIEEVENLHLDGISWERLELLGLEYRFVAQYLQGTIKSRNDLFQKLSIAIAQFAKRQRTWFRGMERRGQPVHWLPDAETGTALKALKRHTAR